MKGKGANNNLYKRQMIIEFHKAGMTFESGYFESIKDIVREEIEEEKGTVWGALVPAGSPRTTAKQQAYHRRFRAQTREARDTPAPKYCRRQGILELGVDFRWGRASEVQTYLSLAWRRDFLAVARSPPSRSMSKCSTLRCRGPPTCLTLAGKIDFPSQGWISCIWANREA